MKRNRQIISYPKDKMSVRVKTLQKHITLHDVEDNCLEFHWNCDNESIDKWVSREFKASLNDLCKRNLMWVFQVKRIAQWKRGEFLYGYMKSNCDGMYRIYYSKQKEEIGFYDLIIEPGGYACMRVFNHYVSDETDEVKHSLFIRVDSVYNDRICDMNRLIEK